MLPCYLIIYIRTKYKHGNVFGLKKREKSLTGIATQVYYGQKNIYYNYFRLFSYKDVVFLPTYTLKAHRMVSKTNGKKV